MKLERKLHDWEKALMERGNLYLVGGVVRDILFGRAESGLDEDYLLRGLSLEEAFSILDNYGNCDLVGKSFGVLKFTPSGGSTVDIALPRREFSTGWGHKDFEVSFSPDLPVEEDLIRRDFTINSMALDLNRMELIDPLNGREDIRKRTMRVNREESFNEDPLRIVRGVQFKYRFELEVEEETEKLMEDYGHLVATVPAERVREELNKMMLMAERPGDGFMFMHRIGILEYIIPELDETYGIEQNEYHPDDIFTHSIKSCNVAEPNLLARWTALLHDLGKRETRREKEGRVVFYSHEMVSEIIAANILKRLKFSNGFTRDAVHLIRNHMFRIDEECSDSAVRRFISKVGLDHLDDLFALRKADALSRGDNESVENIDYVRKRVSEMLSEEAAFKVKDLEINGNEIMELTGLSAGREVGEILNNLFNMVIDDPELNRNKELRRIVRERYGEKK